MGNIKEINFKNRSFYFFNDMTDLKDLDSNLSKIGKNRTKT